MQLPKKIDHQNLIETVVELRFIPSEEFNRDLWAGMLATQLGNLGYIYHNVPQIKIVPKSDGVLKFTLDNESINSAINLFINEENGMRVIIDNTKISFNNSQGKYLGWEQYFNNIVQILEIVCSSKIIHYFDRTMIRFINEYDYNIIDKLEINVEISSQIEYETREISFSNVKNSTVSFVSISGLRERISKFSKEKRSTSLFDINVFEKLNPESTLKEVGESLNKIHGIEKETFFSLLKKDYLDSLNPEY